MNEIIASPVIPAMTTLLFVAALIMAVYEIHKNGYDWLANIGKIIMATGFIAFWATVTFLRASNLITAPSNFMTAWANINQIVLAATWIIVVSYRLKTRGM